MRKSLIFLILGIILMYSCASQPASEGTDKNMMIEAPIAWESTEILINPKSDGTHSPVSIKDPTVVFYEGMWHVYATIYDTAIETWNMVYLTFADWADADSAELQYMDSNPNFKGYNCAPQVFYFEPQKKWYLIYQSQPPTYSTADEIGGPSNWSERKYFYRGKPKSAPNMWIDYWIICDDKNAYMFFSGDDGKLYRSQTSLANFPEGFGAITVVMSFPVNRELFEGCNVYKIKGMDKYLLLNECADANWTRYFKAFISDSIKGRWFELAASEEDPFFGAPNVTFEKGRMPWTKDFSHGEMLRTGYDQKMEIDSKNLQFLYQGSTGPGARYSLIPWSLGMLKQVGPANAKSIFDVDLATLTPYVLTMTENEEIPEYEELPGEEGDKNVLAVELESLADQATFAPMEVVPDEEASGGAAIAWPESDGEAHLATPSNDAEGQVSVKFNLSEAATVELLILMFMGSADDDSFYYKMDDGAWDTQNNVQTAGYERTPLKRYELEAGEHVLSILRRENDSFLDKVVLKASAGEISRL